MVQDLHQLLKPLCVSKTTSFREGGQMHTLRVYLEGGLSLPLSFGATMEGNEGLYVYTP